MAPIRRGGGGGGGGVLAVFAGWTASSLRPEERWAGSWSRSAPVPEWPCPLWRTPRPGPGSPPLSGAAFLFSVKPAGEAHE